MDDDQVQVLDEIYQQLAGVFNSLQAMQMSLSTRNSIHSDHSELLNSTSFSPNLSFEEVRVLLRQQTAQNKLSGPKRCFQANLFGNDNSNSMDAICVWCLEHIQGEHLNVTTCCNGRFHSECALASETQRVSRCCPRCRQKCGDRISLMIQKRLRRPPVTQGS